VIAFIGVGYLGLVDAFVGVGYVGPGGMEDQDSALGKEARVRKQESL